MKSVCIWLLVAFTCGGLVGCAPDDSSQSNAVLIGISSEPYPPFSEKAANGQWQGWEIEITDAVCAAVDEDCEYVEIAWDGLIPALLSGKIDVIMASLSITEERMRTIDFSDKYYSSAVVIVAAKDSDISADPATTEGKVLGVQVATIHANYIEKHFAGFIEGMRTYQNFDEHNQDLVAGRIDAVVADAVAMQPFLESRAGQCCEIKDELDDPEIFGPGVGYGLRKDAGELRIMLNDAIEQIRADGTYDAISEKYFDFDIYGAG